jgi:hypothetical protein
MSRQTRAIEDVLRLCTSIHVDAQEIFYKPDDDYLLTRSRIDQSAWDVYALLQDRIHELPPTVVVACRRLAYFVVNYRETQFWADAKREEADEIPLLVHESDKCLREIEEEYGRSTRSAVVEELIFTFPEGILQSDVTAVVNLTYTEALIDFSNGCFMSSITLCGKVIETVLAALYARVTGGDADAEKLGADAIANRLRKAGYVFKGTMKEQLEIVKAHRNKAVHGSIIIPTVDEARGVLSLARDVLQKASSK